jgi:hypothetical protein
MCGVALYSVYDLQYCVLRFTFPPHVVWKNGILLKYTRILFPQTSTRRNLDHNMELGSYLGPMEGLMMKLKNRSW